MTEPIPFGNPAHTDDTPELHAFLKAQAQRDNAAIAAGFMAVKMPLTPSYHRKKDGWLIVQADGSVAYVGFWRSVWMTIFGPPK